jgi:CheY-like chemotaxis protein
MGTSAQRAEISGGPRQGVVLIVDDDSDAISHARAVIAAACPQLRAVGLRSGEELISYLTGEHGFCDRAEYPYPVLIVLDLMMPGMHGFEVLAWLANHPPHNTIPAVVLTGSGDVPVARQAYTLGARSFLTTPMKAGEFMEALAVIGVFPPVPESGEVPPALPPNC